MFQKPKNVNSMPEITITDKGVEGLLKGLNPNKASGPDEISPRLLKELHAEIAHILTKIYRSSLSTGIVPDDWKTALVAPVYKKGPKCKPSNYRPISLNALLGKFLTTLKIYKQTDLIIMDFSKAFDKVDHNLLIYKLFNLGVNLNTVSWVKSFLQNRSQSVVVEGKQSSTVPVMSGVPQGSVLGPCLFLAYINYLPESLKSRARLFADDTIVYLTITSESDSQTLQDDLLKLEQWESDWPMEFNPDKCEVIRVTKKQNPIIFPYELHNTELKATENAQNISESQLMKSSHGNHTLKIWPPKLLTPLNSLNEMYRQIIRK